MASATAFYEFPTIPDPDAFEHGVRNALDAVELSAASLEAVVAEARWAFEAHAALFEELAVTTGHTAPQAGR